MKLSHFEALRPVCPGCSPGGAGAPLKLGRALREDAQDVLEGLLVCSDPACQREFPILDGIPFLVPDVRSFIAQNAGHLTARDDLSAEVESLLGDCAGPGSSFDATRQHLSNYAWDHYADLDPAEEPGAVRPGAAARLLREVLDLAGLEGAPAPGPALDVGCSVGRVSFELSARGEGLVLGVDLHVPMLRLASRILRQGQVRYPRRRVGLVYDRREFPAALPGADRVDFWACDATRLPFAPGTFALTSSLNVVDCVSSPLEHLEELARVLRPEGLALLASPYDWAPAATAVEAWIGGHSQRGGAGGDSAALLRSLLTPGAHPQSVAGLALAAERDGLPWQVRTHERGVMGYRCHALVARRVGG